MSVNVSQHLHYIQGILLPFLERNDGPYTENHQRLLKIIEFTRPESFIHQFYGSVGRPMQDRAAIARAFIAKSVFGLSETKALIERLNIDPVLRRLCGFDGRNSIPSEATFSRSFAEFAKSELAQKMHRYFIESQYADCLVQHVSTDSTAIEAREKAKVAEKPKDALPKEIKKKGRPKKGEVREPKDPKRLERQQHMSLGEMIADLPIACDIGCKKDSKGYKMSWKGYKLHLSVGDGDVPIAAILTSASVHDSQVALPLTRIASSRVDYLYNLLDAAYDAEIIRGDFAKAGKVSLIDFNRRSKDDHRAFTPSEASHYNARSSVERVNGNLKDNFAGTKIMVRGAAKVFTHLMFGVLAITVEQTIRWVT